jgi:hypothetical protein
MKQLRDFFRYLLTLGWTFTATAATADITYWDMESGTFEDYGWDTSGSVAAFSAVGEPACSGERSLKYDLQFYTSPTAYRMEFTSIETDGSNELDYFTEYWIGFNVFVPEDWKYDKNGEIIFQLQQHPDEGEAYRNPPLVFRIDGDNWGASWAANHNKINEWKDYTVHEEAQLSLIQKGTWNSVVLNFKTSFNSDGFYRVFVNGNLDLDYQGPIFYNDDKGPYIKFGLYKPSWKPKAIEAGWGGVYDGISQRIYFQDDIKIFRGSNGQESVTTSCGGSNPNPVTPEITQINQGQPITPVNAELIYYSVAGDDVSGVKTICLTDSASKEICTRSVNAHATGGRMSFTSEEVNTLQSGDASVSVTYQDTLYDSEGSNPPLTESATYNVNVEAYSGEQWGSSDGITITNTGGIGWAGMSDANEVTIANNTPVEVLYKLKAVPGDAPAAIRFTTQAGGFVEMSGVLGALALTETSTGSGHTLEQWHVDDIHWVLLTMTTTETEDYEYRIAPNTEAAGDQIHFLRWKLWGDDAEQTLSKPHPVEHPASVVPNPPTLLPIY